jgi:hypothetical protein
MDLELLKVILQSVSTLSLVGGVVYAAFQLKAHQRAQHVANFTKLVEMQMQLRRMRVDDPSLAAIYAHDVRHLDSDREIREHFMNLMQVSVFEVVWFAHKHGQVPADYFESWVARMREIAAEPSFRRAMDSHNMKILHDEFERYIKEMVRATPERAG